MSAKPFAATLAAAALLAGQALAAGPATVAKASGEVLVVGAKGSATARTGAQVQAGDRVVVRKGEATIRFADGCPVKLTAGAMVTVGATSPCAGGKGLVSVQPAEAAQWWKLPQMGSIGQMSAGTVLAGAGSLLLIGAVAYGLTDPTDCDGDLSTDGTCTASP